MREDDSRMNMLQMEGEPDDEELRRLEEENEADEEFLLPEPEDTLTMEDAENGPEGRASGEVGGADQDTVRQYLREIGSIPLLTPEQERKVAMSCAEGDEEDQDHHDDIGISNTFGHDLHFLVELELSVLKKLNHFHTLTKEELRQLQKLVKSIIRIITTQDLLYQII